jgi:hypothetical protein
MNPAISAIIDTNYYHDDSGEGFEHVLGEIEGFGHAHSHDHGHAHGGMENGFNLREVELFLGADVDPYFSAYVTAAYHEGGSEIEEAVVKTTCLPWGLEVKGGKFLSDFGRINSQHPHEWDFVDRPLIYELTLGDHGLLEKGVQLSWLAPTPFYCLLGAEALQGENERMFSHLGGESLPDESGPRLYVAWAKVSPPMGRRHGTQFGLFAGRGVHQEEHDADSDGQEDHWLDGYSTFWGADFVYKYEAPKQHGHGDVTVQAEYMRRRKDLDLVETDPGAGGPPMALVGGDRTDEQDGFYVQSTYGFLPRWRGGVRYELIGLTNKSEYPNGSTAHFDDGRRTTAMLEFSPSEFSVLRLQAGKAELQLHDGEEDIWQVFFQWIVSIGSHGAHQW